MTDKPTLEMLEAAAKARGIAIPPEQAPTALAGAVWLKQCVVLIRQSGLVK